MDEVLEGGLRRLVQLLHAHHVRQILVVDARVRPDKLAELPQTQVQYCEPARPSTFVVGPGNHRRWELMLLPGEPLHEHWPEDTLWPLLARWIQPGDIV